MHIHITASYLHNTIVLLLEERQIRQAEQADRHTDRLTGNSWGRKRRKLENMDCIALRDLWTIPYLIICYLECNTIDTFTVINRCHKHHQLIKQKHKGIHLYTRCWGKNMRRGISKSKVKIWSQKQAGLDGGAEGRGVRFSCGTMLDLPFPPCVALTVQTAATESKPARQTDRQTVIRERQEHAMTHETSQTHTLFHLYKLTPSNFYNSALFEDLILINCSR